MIAAECYFLDVGQASAHVVDLGKGRAIVIDCGGPFNVALELLDRLGIKRIVAIALTHNHVDHSAGIRRVVEQYRRQIDLIAFLQDEHAQRLMKRRVLQFLFKEARQKNIPRPICLQRQPDRCYLYQSADVRVEIVYPDFMENIEAQAAGQENACSAVLRLQCGSRKMVFPGDAEMNVWKAIRDQRDNPLTCDVLAVPHHGGQIVRHRRMGESDEDFYNSTRPEYDWLYTDCIRPKYAVVSAGTDNTNNHPIPVHLDALRGAGAKVLCTQVTERCHSNVTNLAPAVLQPQSLPGHAKGRNPGVACAGTILVQIGRDEVSVDRFDQHRQAVQHNIPSPRCNT
jgi:competence protein ComEC